MAGREKRGSLTSPPTNMPAPPVPRRSRAGTPMPGAGTPVPRAGTPIPHQRSSSVPRAHKVSTVIPNQRSATPGPGGRGSKSAETQTSVLPKKLTLQQKRSFSSPRSESPGSMLRNGRPKMSRNNSLLLDGIPIVKRTRSLVSESETSSVSGMFNDSASVDGFFNFNPPDSPLESRMNAFLTPDSLSLLNTPRRGRQRRLSETSNVSSMSTRSASAPRKKRDSLAPPKSPVVATPKRGAKAQQTKAVGAAKVTKKVVVKRKRVDAAESEPSAKKLKTVTKGPNPKAKMTKKIKGTTTKNTNQTRVIKVAKRKIVQRISKDKEIAGMRKTAGKTKKLTKVQLAQKISRTTKESAVRADTRKKNMILKRAKKNLIVNKRAVRGEMPVVKRRKQAVADTETKPTKGRKREDKQADNVEVPEKSVSTNDPAPAAKKQIGRKKQNEPEEPKMQDAATETVRKTKNLNIKSSTAPKPAAKTVVMKKVCLPPQADTLKTLTQVSKILEKIAESQENSDEEESKKEAEQETKAEQKEEKKEEKEEGAAKVEHESITPVPASPKLQSSSVAADGESDTACSSTEKEKQPDSSHVSPINTLANILRHKLLQPSPPQVSQAVQTCQPSVSPTLKLAESPQMPPPPPPPVNGTVHVVTVPQSSKSNSKTVKPRLSPSAPLPRKKPLPIINSLSAAAKQTSSFLRQMDDSTEIPVTKRDSEYQINKTIIYTKMKSDSPSVGPQHTMIQVSPGNYMFSTKKATSVLKTRNLPVKALFTSETKTGSVQSKVPEAETVKQNGDVPMSRPDEALDNNENKLDAKVDQVPDNCSAPVQDDSTQGVGAASINTETEKQASNSSNLPIPEKDKLILDNHSEPSVVTEAVEVAAASPLTEAHLNSDKTDSSVKQSTEKAGLELEEAESSSDASFKTPECTSPTNAETEAPKDSTTSVEPSTANPPEALEAVATTEESTATNVNDIFSIIPPSLLNPDPSKRPTLPFEEEDLVAKESVLGALGLRSNHSISEEAKVPKVPKLRLVCRPPHKKHRRSTNHDSSTSGGYKEKTYTVCREGDPYVDWDRPSPSKSTRAADSDSGTRNLLWYPRMPLSNGKAVEPMVDGTVAEVGVGVGDGPGEDATEGGEKSAEPLVIPEKSSSFGIHPGRLCDDVCSYCHNKFGLYDTPLHIAQLKGFEKQQQVLKREPLITLESCLCDACYRHLERPLAIRGPKPAVAKQKAQPQANQTCCFTGCYQPAAHTMMRKWKRRAKSLLPEDLQDPKVTNWLCENHYSELARIGPCGLCLRRLNRQQMYELEASAVSPLNKLLRHDHIPVTLDSTMSLCKKCRFYTSLRLRTEDNSKLTSANRIFLREHRVRVLKGRNLSTESLPDMFGETEKSKKQSKKKDKAPAEAPATTLAPVQQPPVVASSSASSSNPAPTPNTSPVKTTPKPKLRIKLNTPTRKMPTNARMSTGNPRMPPPPPPPAKLSPVMATKSTASQVKLNSGIKLPSQTNITLQPRPIAPAPPKLTSSAVQISPVLSRLAEKGELRRVTSQNSGSSLLSRIGLTKYPSPSATVTSNALQQAPQVTIVPIPAKQSAAKTSPRLQQSSRASTSTQQEEFPSTSEVAMNARFDFQATDESAAWQKVNATFQFDTKTRRLWNDLHAPYGSYTSFLRHLVFLESHWRNGDLVLAPTASTQSRQYLTSVQNRIKSYEGVPSEQDSALHSMPLISDVRSLATGETSESWGAPPQ